MEKIMVVDNEPETVGMIKTMLETEGYKVIPAYSGKECLEKLKKQKVAVVVLDVMMPGLSGWDVLEAIRRKDKKTPIMFLTVMFAPKERIAELKKHGVCAYVTKPFGAEELITTVRKCSTK